MPADVLGARTAVAAYAEAYAVTATDTLVPWIVQRQGSAVAAASGTGLVATTGKVLRLQKLSMSLTVVGTTPNTTRVRLRVPTAAGAVAVTSPILFNKRYGTPPGTLVANQVFDFTEDFPDGYEIAAGFGVGLTMIGTASMHTFDVSLLGFEYNA